MIFAQKSDRFTFLNYVMIENNLHEIRNRIREACEQCGRNPDDILLIAVSKNFGTEAIREAAETGQNHFGENKAQELRDKFDDIGDQVFWHFIGHLQSNKVKYAVRAAEYIHSVDSLKIARKIASEAAKISKRQKVLVEIKTSEEDSKFGLENFNAINEIVEFCAASSDLDLQGLMTMAPFTDDQEIIRHSFASLRELRDNLKTPDCPLRHLSMGMTNDFPVAIAEGATMLRIGTAIFGNKYAP